jgi:hypothetical protein
VIVALNSNGAWFKVQTELGPSAYFAAVKTEEETNRVEGRSTWIPVEPLFTFQNFGPELQAARIRLEHVTLFGITV